MLLGADTIRPQLRKLVPGVEFIARPRFSTAHLYRAAQADAPAAAECRRGLLRSPEVYALAEAMRRQRGGTAVVLGALSPRTRNAQVGDVSRRARSTTWWQPTPSAWGSTWT